MNAEEAQATIKLPDESIVEEEGYGVPFKTFTWTQWEDMHKQTYLRFARFQHAIEQGQTDKALLVALEMDEMVSEWLTEVCAQLLFVG